MNESEIQEYIQDLCDELAACFGPDTYVTVLVRNPKDPKQGCLMTEDEVEEIIPAIKRFAYRN